ncbi:MAG: 2Fe-2S iron-sulfur cluster-binding protein [Aliidongia sp.]
MPRLCHHPDLEPAGNCRVCTCKINGRNAAACVTPAAHGMVIENKTKQLTDDRRAVIEMLFVEGNHPCPYCVASGDCELQGPGLSPGHGGADSILPVAGAQDRCHSPRTSISIMTAASFVRAASAPPEWRTASRCSASKAAASPCG